MKKNWDIIIVMVWVLVLIIWIGTYFFTKSNYFNKEVKDILVEETDDGVYQFLLDTKKVYCKVFELWDYYNNLKKDAREWETNIGSKETLILMSKKSLEKANILWLSWAIESYVNKYSNSPFSESVNLMRLRYNYIIKTLKSTDKINNDDVEWFFIDYKTYIDAANETKATLLDVLLQEYKAVRWEDETLRPESESILLDFENICLKNENKEESETEEN